MMNFKAICVATLLSLFSLVAVAQSNYKVKDKSSRKSPEWFGGMQKDYIITSAISDDIEKAKEICMDNVRTQIIESVAVNVKSSSESNISQETVNNQISSFLDEFSSSLKTQSANIPYMASVSTSKVEGYYWEKREAKKTKAISYIYSIKYPFSAFELKKLVMEFNKQDELMESNLDELEEGLNSLSSVDEIGMALSSLQSLKKYFFDDVRQNRLTEVIKTYNNLSRQISLERVSDKLGIEEYALFLGDKIVPYSKPPKVKSNTAYELETSKKDSVWQVKYNYSTCYVGEENYIDVSWFINGRTLKNRFYIRLEENSN